MIKKEENDNNIYSVGEGYKSGVHKEKIYPNWGTANIQARP